MTASTRYERNLPGILDDLSAGPAPEYLDDVFARTGRMRQRPGWTFPERWLPVADIARTRAFAPAPPWRLIAVALVVIALVLAALLRRRLAAQGRAAVRPGPQRRDRVRLRRRPVRRQPRHRCEPVAGRRPRGRQRARLLAGRHPGRVLPGGRLLSADRRHRCGQGGWIGPGKVNVGAARRRSHLGQLDAGQPASGVIHGPGRWRSLWSSSTSRAASRRASWRRTWTCSRWRSARQTGGRSRSGRSSTRDRRVFVMNADGTGVPRTLLEPNVSLDMGNHANNMVYSADGKRLFYQSYTPGD